MTDDQTMTIPKLADVAVVRLAVSVECWPTLPDGRSLPTDDDGNVLDYYVERLAEDVERALHNARLAVRDYLAPIARTVGADAVDRGEDVEESDYDGSVLAFHGSAFVDVAPEQWLTISDGYGLDLDWRELPDGPPHAERIDDPADIPALPDERYLVPTLGILGADGLIPAVAIEGTEEGWGSYSHEPSLIASFYVALAMRDGSAEGADAS